MSGKVALFAGPTRAAFRNLKACQSHPQVAGLVQRAADTLKNSGASLDLLKELEKEAWTASEETDEEGANSVAVKLVSQLAGFLTQYSLEAVPTDFLATTGDRPGMFAAVLVAASNDTAALLTHLDSFLKAALIAGAKTESSAKAIAEQWHAKGIKLPTASALRLPVLGCDGRGDLRACKDLTTELASLCLHIDYEENAAMEAAHKEVRAKIETVVDFGCPASKNGRIGLPVDGVRDLATLNYMLPDVAEIKKEVIKRGYTWDISLVHSFLWLAHDVVINAALMYLTYLVLPFFSNTLTWTVLWPLYSVVVGTTLTGIWVIGHECGHRAFAGTGANSWINDVVGVITHTPLLVPFWAWRFSHHKHHMFTNHLLDGETHVPAHKNGTGLDKAAMKITGEEGFVFWNIVQHLVFGWPLYLINNATGGRRTPQGKKIDRKKSKSHFKPGSQVFEDNQRPMILPGTTACVAWVAAMFYLDYELGFGTSLFWFWGAYMVVNSWLVLYTWLHHADPEIPHFSDGQFSYMRGATCSCDRNYPAIINYLHHDIGSTHVLHHISFQLPFYFAQNATKVFRERYPHLYRYDTRPLMHTMFEVSKKCHYVDDVQGVQYYKPLELKKKSQ